MLNLSSTSDKVQVGTSSTADLEVRVDYMDAANVAGVITADTFKQDNQHTTIAATPGPTDVLAAPGASTTSRRLMCLSIRNKHASTANTVTVQIINASSTKELFKATLQAGYELVRTMNGSWLMYDATGALIMGAPAASDTVAGVIEIAEVTEMETGTDTVRAVTPGRQHRHPGHPKVWANAVGAGTSLNSSFGVTSLTDTGAGQATFNFSTNFSAATAYAAVASVERASTTMTVTNVQDSAIRNATLLVGSVQVESYDHTATTMVLEDPASYHLVCLGDN